MMMFSLWKQLKKKLKRRRGPLWSMSIILGLAFSVIAASITGAESIFAESNDQQKNKAILELKHVDQPVMVHLQRKYVCGEEKQELGLLEPKQLISLIEQHPEWSAEVRLDDKLVLLEQEIDDLSDYCKSNAYFGVDRVGNFTLFDGLPSNEKIIRTFFQIDVEYMESSLSQDRVDQLAKGIRVSDIDEYNSVLSTFSDYAIKRMDVQQQEKY